MKSTGNTGNGTNNNTFSYTDLAGNTFDREVNAAFNNITFDHVGGTLASSSQAPFSVSIPPQIMPLARLPGGRILGGS